MILLNEAPEGMDVFRKDGNLGLSFLVNLDNSELRE